MSNRISTLEVSKQLSNTAGMRISKKRRKHNLTVRGLSESTSHVPEDRQKDDEAKSREAFQSTGVDYVPKSVRRFWKVTLTSHIYLWLKWRQ